MNSTRVDTWAEEALRLGVTMHKRREDARRLFGDRYEEKVRPWKMVLGAVAKKRNLGILQAALLIAEPKERSGSRLRDFDALLLNAAAVELIEEQSGHAG